MNSTRQIDFAAWAGLIIFSVLYAWRLGFPPDFAFDEVYHVPSARNLLNWTSYSDLAHPPFGKLLLAWSIGFFGDYSWSWRFPSLICGLGTLAVLYLLTARLCASRSIALLTAALVAMDGMLLVQSRMAMLNTIMFLPMWLSLLLLVYAHDQPQNRRTFWLYALSGICIGLAISTRIVALLMVPVLMLYHLLQSIRPLIPDGIKKLKPEWRQLKPLIEILFYWVILPLLVYQAVWLAVIPQLPGKTWIDAWNSHQTMTIYHLQLKASHFSGSAWWSWPFMLEPAWFYFQSKDQIVRGIVAIGNPAVYWMTLPAVFYSLFRFLQEKKFLHGFIAAGFVLLWLPCGLIKRVQFLHYYEAAVPFALMGLALMLAEISRHSRSGRLAAALYLITVTALFFYWLPLWTGLPISESYFRHHMWLKTWI